MTLEADVAAMPEGEDAAWILGGLNLRPSDGSIGIVGDEGLEGIETDTQDGDHAGDGSAPGIQKLSPRAVTLTISLGSNDPDETAGFMAALEQVVQPLPDRIGGFRMLRFRRNGQAARRVYYRPANGQALAVAGDEARIKFNIARGVVVRLECPDGIIVSDEYEDITLPANTPTDVEMNGTLTAVLPLAYTLSAAGGLTLEHLGTTVGEVTTLYPHEVITYPSSGALTVGRRMEARGIDSHGNATYALAHGPDGSQFPDPPLLRPGVNSLRSSRTCTLRKWDTW